MSRSLAPLPHPDEYPEHQSSVGLNGDRNRAEEAVQIIHAVTVFSYIHKVYFMGNLTFGHVMY